MRFLTVIFCLVSLSSCFTDLENNIKTSETPQSMEEVFDSYWSNMNSNYLYWDIDSTNWDLVYKTYKPLFKNLDINEESDIQKSIDYFKIITAHLVDGHYQIHFNSKVLTYPQIINPSLIKKQSDISFRESYNFQDLAKVYLDSGFKEGFDFSSSGNGQKLSVLSGLINESILYFSCNNFYLNNAYSSNSTEVKSVIDYFFSMLNNSRASPKSLIFDFRGNQGGQIGDLNFLIGRLIDRPMHYGYSRAKFGSGKFDYTPWIKAYINPLHVDEVNYHPKIVVLIDSKTASTAELAALAIKEFPQSILVGEKTYGATGPLVSKEIYSYGSFVLEGFMNVQTSSVGFLSKTGVNYEGVGISPNFSVMFNLDSIAIGRDMQLEKAIDTLNL